jgi:hypothetical protein
MTRHAHALALVAAIIASATVHAQLEVIEPTPVEEQALEQFDRAIDDYVALHRRMERLLPPERMFDDAEELFAARDALRQAIVNARPNARRGDLFTASVSHVLRARLLRAIRWHEHDPADILADNRAERLPGTPLPEINEPFAWGLGAEMWPTLLRALPELSEELEYRFVDRDLVLVDVHADRGVKQLARRRHAAQWRTGKPDTSARWTPRRPDATAGMFGGPDCGTFRSDDGRSSQRCT